jgi:uncharacterized membrane protein YqiK
MEQMIETAIILGASIVGVVALLAIAAFTYAKMYKRASADEAIVRTGKGGMRAVAGGGLWSVPILHEVRRVSLRQVKIPIDRTGKDALVTSDKIEADVEGTMFVRVGDEPDDIIQAAKTFGEISDAEIDQMIRDKVTDAMRAEAMKVTFLNLNVQKREFAESIGSSVAEDLKKTGLVLDTVAVTSIQQVKVNPDAIPMDVFKAEGARNIVEVVEKNREETNRIRRKKEIEVQQVNVDTRKQALALEMEQKKAEADQTKEVGEYEARMATKEQEAVLEQERIAEEAAIAKAEEVAKRDITKNQALAVREAEKVEAEQVAAKRATQAIEAAEIEKNKAVETARIAKEREVEQATIEKSKTVETAEIEKQKAIAEAKEAEALARAKQADAEALEEKASQSIATVTETETANRTKQVAVIKAEEQARQQVIEAEAERDARKAKAEAEAKEAEQQAAAAKAEAQGRADALTLDAEAHAMNVKTRAEADAEAHATDVRTRAEADAEAADLQAAAKIKLAAATLKQGEAAAEAERLMVEAGNAISDKLLLRDVAVAAIERTPEAIEAFMKPAAAIGDVRVLNLQGLGGTAGENGEALSSGLPGIVAGSLAQSAGLLPVISSLLDFAKESGVTDKVKEAAADVLVQAQETLKVEPGALPAKGGDNGQTEQHQ